MLLSTQATDDDDDEMSDECEYVCDVYIHRKQNPVVEMNIRRYVLNIAPLNAPRWMLS